MLIWTVYLFGFSVVKRQNRFKNALHWRHHRWHDGVRHFDGHLNNWYHFNTIFPWHLQPGQQLHTHLHPSLTGGSKQSSAQQHTADVTTACTLQPKSAAAAAFLHSSHTLLLLLLLVFLLLCSVQGAVWVPDCEADMKWQLTLAGNQGMLWSPHILEEEADVVCIMVCCGLSCECSQMFLINNTVDTWKYKISCLHIHTLQTAHVLLTYTDVVVVVVVVVNCSLLL